MPIPEPYTFAQKELLYTISKFRERFPGPYLDQSSAGTTYLVLRDALMYVEEQIQRAIQV